MLRVGSGQKVYLLVLLHLLEQTPYYKDSACDQAKSVYYEVTWGLTFGPHVLWAVISSHPQQLHLLSQGSTAKVPERFLFKFLPNSYI